METVFITIHDLTLDARIRYCSESVEDILGYLPHEVKGKSCWEYFHPDEIPFAKAIHGRGVSLDKAAVLNYCRIKHKNGEWIGCECVFTVVYDVLIASTAVYQVGPKSRKRAVDGAGVRRIFSSSPKDPRYHMLSYISNKFYQEPQPHAREPRAAFFLNRFTRTSTIMFATNGVASILGLQPQQLVGKSFYYCIAENCLDDAVRCLESAKGNDSIAYLRFWFRDPTQDDRRAREPSMLSAFSEDDDDDGGVSITSVTRSTSSVQMMSPVPYLTSNSTPQLDARKTPTPETDIAITIEKASPMDNGLVGAEDHPSRSSSDNSANSDPNCRDPIFDPPYLHPVSSTSSTTPQEEQTSIEVEAVVSCTSDGLVVVLRRARPLVPHTASITDEPYFANGVFASPWAAQPVMPAGMDQATVAPAIGFPSVSEPLESGFMAAIRDVAVFAWSLTGINGSLVSHARGEPMGESLPPGGLPVWDPNAKTADERFNGYSNNTHRRFENLSCEMKEEDPNSSDDEILWKRVSQQPPWRPKRRAHQDAFGDDGEPSEPKDADGRDTQSRRRRLEGAA